MKRRLLVACECSGTIRDAFLAKGWDAYSADLVETCKPGPHYVCENDMHIWQIIEENAWDLLIAHPPCKYLSVSGIHWNNRGRGWEETERALAFFKGMLDANVERIAIENPVSIASTRIRKITQSIQPYNYGEDASKRTCLWLKKLPPLRSTGYYPPRMVEYRGKMVKRWSNQTDSGQNALTPSEGRAAARAVTYPGIAQAMAEQWTDAINREGLGQATFAL